MTKKELIGARIKSLRNSKNITQEQLSERTGINPKYLSSIERGKENPTLNTLIRLSETLDVDLWEVFEFVQEESPVMRKNLLISLINEANDEQLKLAVKIFRAIMH
ncbi:MAG: helix-turn-helix transcriptional regulator [Deltaproteobacteria bacterium]|nr:helix-turn-helix transcriptional regulator [Deltaproteobacteria bacterium]MBW2018710.1 helix-turn-helix transcriptional regulator [Deltaproteobacteria bacterium]MBW2073439.1 helix-turn-helix transcriptional regulator [Deltaproteobacteria bacterium]RLB83051.1 MAG: XRE family transcriptional regulator [Deltaproteobacteria bacterium]